MKHALIALAFIGLAYVYQFEFESAALPTQGHARPSNVPEGNTHLVMGSMYATPAPNVPDSNER